MGLILSYFVAFIRNKGFFFVIILGLCFGLWFQSQKLTHLKAENLTQAQTIEQLNNAVEQMSNQLEQEKQAVEYQQKITNELKAQMETERENVKTILIKEPCGGVAMPNAVIDSIKRLHTKGGNKN